MTNEIKKSPKKSSGFWMIAFLLFVFLGPMIGAWMLYHSGSFVPEKINYGQLIQPPYFLKNLPLLTESKKSFNQKQLRGKWVMLYVDPVGCDSNCQQNLFKMRQIRLAMGKDMDRIDRIIVTTTESTDPSVDKLIKQSYPGTLHLYVNSDDLFTFFKSFSHLQDVTKVGYLFFVDPNGNVIMAYSPSEPPKGIMSDLHRLLRISQIG